MTHLDAAVLPQREGVAVANLLDGDAVRLHEFNRALHPRVKIFRKGNQELGDRRVFVDELKSVDVVIVRMAVVGNVDVVDAEGIAGGVDAVAHGCVFGRCVYHHDHAVIAQEDAVGGVNARKNDFENLRTVLKVVFSIRIFNQIDNDGRFCHRECRQKHCHHQE